MKNHLYNTVRAGHLSTQSKQVDWIYNQWNNVNNDFIKISLWIYQMAKTLNSWSLSTCTGFYRFSGKQSLITPYISFVKDDNFYTLLDNTVHTSIQCTGLSHTWGIYFVRAFIGKINYEIPSTLYGGCIGYAREVLKT